jgi:hypothetical protein
MNKLQQSVYLVLLLVMAIAIGWQWQDQQQLQRQIRQGQADSDQLEQLVQTYMDGAGPAYSSVIPLADLKQARQWLRQQVPQLGLAREAMQILIEGDQLHLHLKAVPFNRLLSLIIRVQHSSNLDLRHIKAIAAKTPSQVNARLQWALY